MAQKRLVRVSLDRPTYAVCVLGTETVVDLQGCAPAGCKFFEICASPGVVVDLNCHPIKKLPSGTSKCPLEPGIEMTVKMKAPSTLLNDQKVKISYFGPKSSSDQALLYLTGVQISLDVDTYRNGRVKPTNGKIDKRNWTWGPNGQGAVLLVNCDKDSPKSSTVDAELETTNYKDLKDMSPMILSTQTPKNFFARHELILHVSKFEMDKVRVFQADRKKLPTKYKMVLGPHMPSHVLEVIDGHQENTFYVEGLAFPDLDFSGLVSFTVSLMDISNLPVPEALLFQDTVVFRVAPWIMTPNTQAPQEVYVCRIYDNENFVESVTDLAKKAKCKLTICPEEENMDDIWMQDEIEFGYIQAPHKIFPVVFDSPRNRGLKDFPIRTIRGPDFGYVTREASNEFTTGLDSFGNLEVSPPVTVGDKKYPLGRILIGDSSYPRDQSREMLKILQDFLFAQKVQAPVKLFSDWLSVGHVDEFLSFVPAPDGKGFRLLLASPSACYKLFEEKQKEGHGDAKMLEGVKKKGNKMIKDILSDKTLREHNKYAESCIDWNREVLKQELGLTEQDIIDIPQLFRLKMSLSTNELKAEALFPDMVNMLVLGKYLGIPKPFGPIIDGQCCLEEKIRALLEPLGLKCTFIDDYFTYHIRSGEVHCGTNVRRKPFPFKWWNMTP
ncbi:protein-arginine deiminase type-4-like [Trichosurus vulpecula]|uniref:protein-arginine deiminase type-4-like n=1 Tax=Trichosurus vulpecula TaxID=9337 RepID=UPI00186AFD57|nr:protein-arginine deiminase type-4-like [Trichosurus vulpecula]